MTTTTSKTEGDMRIYVERRMVHGEPCAVLCVSRDALAFMRDLLGQVIDGSGALYPLFEALDGVLGPDVPGGDIPEVDCRRWKPPEWDDNEPWERET